MLHKGQRRVTFLIIIPRCSVTNVISLLTVTSSHGALPQHLTAIPLHTTTAVREFIYMDNAGEGEGNKCSSGALRRHQYHLSQQVFVIQSP